MSSNPYEVKTVKCAGPNCSAVRKEANHWFIVWTDQMPHFNCGRFSFQLIDALGPSCKPVCGQQCAQKLFEQYLSKVVT